MDSLHPSQSVSKHWYDRKAKKDYVLSVINSIALPLMRASVVSMKPYAAFRRTPPRSLVRFETSNDKRMFYIELDLPATRKPVVYAGYVSAQEWYVTPSRAVRSAKRFLRWLRERIPQHVDLYMGFVCNRATSGARKVLARLGVPVQGASFFRKKMVEYFTKRINALKSALMGKRIFGELAFLAWIMALVVAFLSDSPGLNACISLSHLVLKVAENSMEPGPPPGDVFVDSVLRTCLSGSMSG